MAIKVIELAFNLELLRVIYEKEFGMGIVSDYFSYLTFIEYWLVQRVALHHDLRDGYRLCKKVW